jgi:hypothetical protein
MSISKVCASLAFIMVTTLVFRAFVDPEGSAPVTTYLIWGFYMVSGVLYYMWSDI